MALRGVIEYGVPVAFATLFLFLVVKFGHVQDPVQGLANATELPETKTHLLRWFAEGPSQAKTLFIATMLVRIEGALFTAVSLGALYVTFLVPFHQRHPVYFTIAAGMSLVAFVQLQHAGVIPGAHALTIKDPLVNVLAVADSSFALGFWYLFFKSRGASAGESGKKKSQ